MVYKMKKSYLSKVKKLRIAYLLFFFFFSFKLEGGGWPAVEKRADSLCAVLDRSLGTTSDAYQRKLALQMRQISFACPSKSALSWRWRYFYALAIYRTEKDSAVWLLRQARKLCTNRRGYDYDYCRIASLAGILSAYMKWDRLALYKTLRKDIDVYSDFSDSLQVANACVSLGCLLQEIGGLSDAGIYLERAEELYVRLGLGGMASRNRLNIANVYYSMGKKKESLRLLVGLLQDPSLKADTAVRLEVLSSLSSYDARRGNVEWYYRLAKEYGHTKNLIRSSVAMGGVLLTEEKVDSACFYYREALRWISLSSDKSLLGTAWEGLSQCFLHKRQWDSAAIYLQRSKVFSDSVNEVNLPLEISKIDNQLAISRYEEEKQREDEKSMLLRLVFILVVLILIIIGSGGFYLQYSRRKKERVRSEHYRRSMELQQRELATHTLMLNEKQHTMNALLKHIDEKEGVDGIDRNGLMELKSEIKSHLANYEGWDMFRVRFEKVHPHFFMHLQRHCPSLTEGELRLCAFIYAGLENRQIAQLLALQAASVKMARHRIRKKLRLSTADSLERSLRSILGENLA